MPAIVIAVTAAWVGLALWAWHRPASRQPFLKYLCGRWTCRVLWVLSAATGLVALTAGGTLAFEDRESVGVGDWFISSRSFTLQTHFEESSGRVTVGGSLRLMNNSEYTAYNVVSRFGATSSEHPDMFLPFGEVSPANSFPPGEVLGPDIPEGIAMPLLDAVERADGWHYTVHDPLMLIYFGMRYDDAPVNGKRRIQEWVFAYELGTNIASIATTVEKARILPYVRRTWGDW